MFFFSFCKPAASTTIWKKQHVKGGLCIAIIPCSLPFNMPSLVACTSITQAWTSTRVLQYHNKLGSVQNTFLAWPISEDSLQFPCLYNLSSCHPHTNKTRMIREPIRTSQINMKSQLVILLFYRLTDQSRKSTEACSNTASWRSVFISPSF